jgi:hypothetical protein
MALTIAAAKDAVSSLLADLSLPAVQADLAGSRRCVVALYEAERAAHYESVRLSENGRIALNFAVAQDVGSDDRRAYAAEAALYFEASRRLDAARGFDVVRRAGYEVRAVAEVLAGEKGEHYRNLLGDK